MKYEDLPLKCTCGNTQLEVRDYVVVEDVRGVVDGEVVIVKKRMVKMKLEKQQAFYCYKCNRAWLTLK